MIATSKAVAGRQRTLFPDDSNADGTISRYEVIKADELRFLDALWENDVGTTDDAVNDLSAVFTDGGKWRGGIPKRLAKKGWIEKVGVDQSHRKPRNGGTVYIWRIKNRPAVEARRITLRSILAALDAGRNGTDSTMPVVEPVDSAISRTA